MRAFFVSLFILFAATSWADIPKPATIDETLDLMLERVLPTFPQAQIDTRARNIKLDPVGGAIINPDNIHAVLQNIDDGAAREAELDGFVATLLSAMTQEPRDTSTLPLDQIYPVVRHVDFAKGAAGADLFSLPYIGDMMRVYAIDYPDRVAYVTYTDLEDAGVSTDALEIAAYTNLAQVMSRIQIQDEDGFYFLKGDGFYESSVILDGGLWAYLADQLEDEIVMIVPARDAVAFAPRSNTDAVEFLDTLRAGILNEGSHQLSELTYIWRDEAWQVYP